MTAGTSAAVAGPGDPTAAISARAGYMMGDNVEREWTPEHALAWEGFLELSRRLRRDAEHLLDEHGDLGVSGLGILGRLSRAESRTLRQTALAEAMGLSLSRVSRLIDALEARGFVTRNPCPGDARATNVELTAAGATVARRAQDSVFAFVQDRFFAPLTEADVQVLASVFTRLLAGVDPGRDPVAC
jgi:DNA-binding MarR family transcriptional regulator